MIYEDYADIYRTFAQIDLENIVHNGSVAREVFPGQKLLCVLKADAYGHGIAGVLPAYETFADGYAVATVDEGLLVREQSTKPVLLFGPVPRGRMAEAARSDLTFTVGSPEYARVLSEELKHQGLSGSCHLKIDTGLNRLGISWREEEKALDQIREIHDFKNLCFTGTYTHFACGEGEEAWEQDFTRLQFVRFEKACEAMEKVGIPVGIRHCCATGAALVHPEYRLDMVRLGMLPLGMSYSDESVQALGLRQALCWVSYLSQTKTVAAGEAISYGCTYRAQKDMRIGMVTCGYADGYRRTYSNKTQVLVEGNRAAVVGRVAMDYLLIDITDIPKADRGSAVVLLGHQGEECVSAQELSFLGESVSGEVTCAISARVPRMYCK